MESCVRTAISMHGLRQRGLAVAASAFGLCLLLHLLPAAVTHAREADDELLIKKVAQQLLKVTPPAYPNKLDWPPHFGLITDPEVIERKGKYNAIATRYSAYGAIEDERTGRVRPFIGVTPAVMRDIVQGDDSRLAFILAHELTHVTRGHIFSERQQNFVGWIFSKQEEFEADRGGMELVVRACFSRQHALSALTRWHQKGDYSSFEGTSVDHPSWNDRLAQLDAENRTLWRAMSAFSNGEFFLRFEQYRAAESCFRHVVEEFPEAYEARANLGYARLMMYCDALETEELRGRDIGQFVVGGFYHRPESLKVLIPRGEKQDLWSKAVADMRQAIHQAPRSPLKGDLLWARASLGLAFLVHPDGKDVPTATRYLQDALDEAGKLSAQELPDADRSVLWLNGAVADLAAGRHEEAARKLDQAEKLGRSAGVHGELAGSLDCALCYNHALLRLPSTDMTQQREALTRLQRFLQVASPASAWRPLAHERYTQLCRRLGVPAKKETELLAEAKASWRLPVAVEILSSKSRSPVTIMLSEPWQDVKESLGEGQEITVVPNTPLKRRHYPDLGIDLLTTDQVLAICLVSDRAPPLTLLGAGPAVKKRTLHLGMGGQELQQALVLDAAEDGYQDFLDPQQRGHRLVYRDPLIYGDQDKNAMGLEALLDDQGRVKEFVLAQFPRSARAATQP